MDGTSIKINPSFVRYFVNCLRNSTGLTMCSNTWLRIIKSYFSDSSKTSKDPFLTSTSFSLAASKKSSSKSSPNTLDPLSLKTLNIPPAPQPTSSTLLGLKIELTNW